LEITTTPRERLGDLVTPQAADPDEPLTPEGSFVRNGTSMICREEGKRLAAVKFSVRDRDLASAVGDAQRAVNAIIPLGYRTEWSGEFKNMQEGEGRLLVIIPLSLALIFMLLYLAFHSFQDAVVVLFNVVELSLGGIWALFLSGTNFSIAAAVGFTSIFGVAIMDGLLLVSAFNQLRAHGLPLREAIMQGAERRVRPVMMTALTAIFGLLPAALSTKIGAQSQKPLAIVVVGSMVTTLFLTRYLMPVLYSFYGDREPPAGAGDKRSGIKRSYRRGNWLPKVASARHFMPLPLTAAGIAGDIVASSDRGGKWPRSVTWFNVMRLITDQLHRTGRVHRFGTVYSFREWDVQAGVA
jgi:cobalt-zinc-cadmium resistance protein CzcA